MDGRWEREMMGEDKRAKSRRTESYSAASLVLNSEVWNTLLLL
tara:strand:- start:123 stop:251 length:129 start_codon:yes stop_codon:yes gene_type:complete